MVKVKRDEQAINEIIHRLNRAWQKTAAEAIKRLYNLMEHGKKVDAAVAILQKEYPALFMLPDLEAALVEAAAYGYGIAPKLLDAKQRIEWGEALAQAWNDNGMKLSEKLHGTSKQMRNNIVETVNKQMRNNNSWLTAARALYDGYVSGQKVTREQAIADYMLAVRRSTGNDSIDMRLQRKAADNITRLAQKGAPNKALKSAYNELLRAVREGQSRQIEKACYAAVQEKSRYVAERITRTEIARAWADGFWANALNDNDVVAVRFKLSSRHPVFDICDMYSRADMQGLGKGVFLKNKAPALPVHPHCLCNYVEVYKGEIDIIKQVHQEQAAGDKWLKGLSQRQRQQVLTIDGEKAWQNGADWRKYMHNWNGLSNPQTRLAGKIESLMELNLLEPTDEFIASIAKKYGLEYNVGKKGNERFYAEDGKPIYPPNGGFLGKPEVITLKAGTIIVDRYGGPHGKFVAPQNTPFEQRSLPEVSFQRPYHVYEIIKDIEKVKAGTTAPWFGKPGGGIQYELPNEIRLLEGYIHEIR